MSPIRLRPWRNERWYFSRWPAGLAYVAAARARQVPIYAVPLGKQATGKLLAVARGVTVFGFAPTGDGFAFQGAALLPAGAVEKPIDAASGHGLGADAPGLYRVVGSFDGLRTSPGAGWVG